MEARTTDWEMKRDCGRNNNDHVIWPDHGAAPAMWLDMIVSLRMSFPYESPTPPWPGVLELRTGELLKHNSAGVWRARDGLFEHLPGLEWPQLSVLLARTRMWG